MATLIAGLHVCTRWRWTTNSGTFFAESGVCSANLQNLNGAAATALSSMPTLFSILAFIYFGHATTHSKGNLRTP